MANNRWNSPLRGSFHRGQRPQESPKPIVACRWCDQVFTSNEDLINHVDSHVERGDVGFRRGSSPFPNRFPQPNIPMPMPMPMREPWSFVDNRMLSPPPFQPAVMHPVTINPFSGGGRLAAVPPMHQFQPPSPRNNTKMMIPNLIGSPFHQLCMEKSPVDGTMPYIMLLEKPFKGIEVINLDDDNEEDANPDRQVDLSLTL